MKISGRASGANPKSLVEPVRVPGRKDDAAQPEKIRMRRDRLHQTILQGRGHDAPRGRTRRQIGECCRDQSLRGEGDLTMLVENPKAE